MRPRSSWLLAPLAALLSVALVACGTQDGLALARKACGHVERSIALYKRSEKLSNPKNAAQLQTAALIQLRYAEPIAADATTDSTQWQALMATLSESSRVPEAHLIHALTAQCNSAFHFDSVQPDENQPVVPTTGPSSQKTAAGGS